MNRYLYHLVLVIVVSIVVLAINIMAFMSKNVSDYLYIFDLTYTVGNSAHFVALSISERCISVKDQTSNS
ncbi:hypothetical protein [Cuniculiplasma divulgatum]|uniref:Uncharacterized protein n=1 Tax=Cuniculiplasma divulgatum TaxID=1673428 RepID=A0A1N5WGW2_9ARCH|nr:hypothetical protein [Cuniculiplasma divulgatum]SIM84374.1 hypothetical protein CSP5_1821 [Cuniculiplasma divulgatum]